MLEFFYTSHIFIQIFFIQSSSYCGIVSLLYFLTLHLWLIKKKLQRMEICMKKQNNLERLLLRNLRLLQSSLPRMYELKKTKSNLGFFVYFTKVLYDDTIHYIFMAIVPLSTVRNWWVERQKQGISARALWVVRWVWDSVAQLLLRPKKEVVEWEKEFLELMVSEWPEFLKSRWVNTDNIPILQNTLPTWWIKWGLWLWIRRAAGNIADFFPKGQYKSTSDTIILNDVDRLLTIHEFIHSSTEHFINTETWVIQSGIEKSRWNKKRSLPFIQYEHFFLEGMTEYLARQYGKYLNEKYPHLQVPKSESYNLNVEVVEWLINTMDVDFWELVEVFLNGQRHRFFTLIREKIWNQWLKKLRFWMKFWGYSKKALGAFIPLAVSAFVLGSITASPYLFFTLLVWSAVSWTWAIWGHHLSEMVLKRMSFKKRKIRV